ncbi:UNVERIFIED_CONTAM: putative ribosomal RNA small subunit methyltransferase B [Sesamum radiatum]|uniref:Ribosomal RNA small subunit methyltransferase B n=1 Tax=Sesamum radiatum TaxID=300843 RepID=A0AAW2K518_SESRA
MDDEVVATSSELPLPEDFLHFLNRNGLDPSIYVASHSTPRYIRLKPGCEAQLPEIEAEIKCKLNEVGWLPNFYYLPPEVRIASTKAYQEGKIYGIDAASGAAVVALDISQGDHVLDLCAAPGNGEMEENLEIYKEWTARRPWKERKRMAKAMENIDSMMSKQIQDPELIFYGRHSGVVGLSKHNVFRTFDDVEISQSGYDKLKLLTNGFRLLKAGGSLVYSTCSLTVAQNEDIVEQFLSRHVSAELLEIEAAKNWPCRQARIPKTLRFDPLTSSTSGLFVAKFTKLDI